MAVAIGTGTSTRSLAVPGAPGTGGTSASWTISGSNLVILLSIATFDGTNNQTVSAVSWSLGSGTPVQIAETSRGGGSHEFLWAIPAPVAGAGTFTVTLSQSQWYQITATYFTGADQTTPCPTADAITSNVDGSPVTHTPANLTANDASFGGAGSDSNDPSSVAPNQTYLNNTTAINLQAGYATGTTGVTFTWTAAGAGQAIVVSRIVAAGAPAAPPFNGSTDPNPATKNYPRDLRVFSNQANGRLIGSDRMFYGNQGPNYDYPNPIWKVYPPDLRTHIWNGLETTLNFIRPPFQAVDTTPSTGKTYPLSLRTHLSYYIPDENVPFAQTAWPNPTPKAYPTDVRFWSDPALTLVLSGDVPFINEDLTPPTGTLFPLVNRTWTQNGLTSGGTLPFKQSEWPNPTLKAYPVDARTLTQSNINLFIVPPFSQDEWPVQPPAPFNLTLRSSIQTSTTLLTSQTATPFTPLEWALPERKVYPSSLRTHVSYYVSDTTAPFKPIDWPNPVALRYPQDLRTLVQQIKVDVPVVPFPAPFGQSDWTATRGKSYPQDLRTFLNNSLTSLGITGVVPFNQYSWPNPTTRTYPADLRTWILGVISGKPFNQLDWPNPLSTKYPLDLRSFLLSNFDREQTLLLPPPKQPIDWLNPRLKVYALDLRTLVSRGYISQAEFLTSTTPCDVFYVLVDEDMDVESDSDIIVPPC